MLNLALYSDQIIPANAAIDRRLLDILAAKGAGKRIGYIPSGPEPSRKFFNERQAYYAPYGLDLCLFHDVGEPQSAADIAALFACDAIHLSGGHTRGFLERLKRGGMLGPLRDWALAGGVLIGTSAGAILMTPTIATDALFSGKQPEEVTEGEALDLLPFEFFPHLDAKPSYLDALIRYSKLTPRPIIACNNGDGVIVTAGTVEPIGQPLRIADGVVSPLAAFACRPSR